MRALQLSTGTAAIGQDARISDQLTGGMANGFLWKQLTVSERAVYVRGQNEGAVAFQCYADALAPNQKQIHQQTVNYFLAPAFTSADIAKEITVLYGSWDDNIRIPIVFMEQTAASALKGASSSKTQKELATYRATIRR